MDTTLFNYNTQQESLILSEYGRAFQNLVAYVVQIDDRAKRTKLANGLICTMETLNPSITEQSDYLHTLWDHLYIISDYKLDVDSPYPMPVKPSDAIKPEKIPYANQTIKFRYYGRNLQNLIHKLTQLQDDSLQEEFINLVASFMSNSSRNWNSEALNNAQIVEHLKLMSGGVIQANPDEISITTEQRIKKNYSAMPFNNKNKNKFYKKNKFKK